MRLSDLYRVDETEEPDSSLTGLRDAIMKAASRLSTLHGPEMFEKCIADGRKLIELFKSFETEKGLTFRLEDVRWKWQMGTMLVRGRLNARVDPYEKEVSIVTWDFDPIDYNGSKSFAGWRGWILKKSELSHMPTYVDIAAEDQ